jgi:hypothetical protein
MGKDYDKALNITDGSTQKLIESETTAGMAAEQ